mmetsp:Transcript_21241/g.46359  ORF Transcript_21241/g.46359 Transcript_21241/m.46359 type:complete len:99 (+) Transcript_21241:550-846(+)
MLWRIPVCRDCTTRVATDGIIRCRSATADCVAFALPFAIRVRRRVMSCLYRPVSPDGTPPPSHDEMLRASGGTVRLLPATRGRGGLMRMRMRSSILDQ